MIALKSILKALFPSIPEKDYIDLLQLYGLYEEAPFWLTRFLNSFTHKESTLKTPFEVSRRSFNKVCNFLTALSELVGEESWEIIEDCIAISLKVNGHKVYGSVNFKKEESHFMVQVNRKKNNHFRITLEMKNDSYKAFQNLREILQILEDSGFPELSQVETLEQELIYIDGFKDKQLDHLVNLSEEGFNKSKALGSFNLNLRSPKEDLNVLLNYAPRVMGAMLNIELAENKLARIKKFFYKLSRLSYLNYAECEYRYIESGHFCKYYDIIPEAGEYRSREMVWLQFYGREEEMDEIRFQNKNHPLSQTFDLENGLVLENGALPFERFTQEEIELFKQSEILQIFVPEWVQAYQKNEMPFHIQKKLCYLINNKNIDHSYEVIMDEISLTLEQRYASLFDLHFNEESVHQMDTVKLFKFIIDHGKSIIRYLDIYEFCSNLFSASSLKHELQSHLDTLDAVFGLRLDYIISQLLGRSKGSTNFGFSLVQEHAHSYKEKQHSKSMEYFKEEMKHHLFSGSSDESVDDK